MRFQRRRLNARIYRVDEDELNALKKRTDIVAVFIISLMALLIARLWYLQIHRGAEYVRLAENNRVRALDITAPRGNILDRQGRVIIANRPSFNIVWTKEDAPDPDAVIKRLARLTGDDIALFLERIRLAADNPRHIPIKLKEDVDWQTLAAVENNHLELPGVRIMALPRRDYLYQDLASHLIGYLGEISQKELEGKKDEGDESYESGDPIGKMGAEKLFEEHLRGEKGREYMEVDARGFEQRRLKGLEAMPGNDIRLTIDIDLQQAAEAAMAGKQYHDFHESPVPQQGCLSGLIRLYWLSIGNLCLFFSAIASGVFAVIAMQTLNTIETVIRKRKDSLTSDKKE